jgi:hypothetical protein
MGGGSYSSTDRAVRSSALGYTTKSEQEIFTSRSINSAMNPYGVGIRESRDSAEHPNSVAIVIGLDVTGSMGSVPHFLVREGIVTIMANIIQAGVPDPQVLFLGIGDHECDRAPLQVGQFESSDALLDKWLTDIYLEGGGGGNDGESYLLAWYFAAKHTAIDCLEKRGQKGILFTIGDEPVLTEVPSRVLQKMMGEGQYENYTAAALLSAAQSMYHCFHIHIHETSAGSRQRSIDGWKQLLSNNLVVAKRKTDVAHIISSLVLNTISLTKASSQEAPVTITSSEVKEEMML